MPLARSVAPFAQSSSDNDSEEYAPSSGDDRHSHTPSPSPAQKGNNRARKRKRPPHPKFSKLARVLSSSPPRELSKPSNSFDKDHSQSASDPEPDAFLSSADEQPIASSSKALPPPRKRQKFLPRHTTQSSDDLVPRERVYIPEPVEDLGLEPTEFMGPAFGINLIVTVQRVDLPATVLKFDRNAKTLKSIKPAIPVARKSFTTHQVGQDSAHATEEQVKQAQAWFGKGIRGKHAPSPVPIFDRATDEVLGNDTAGVDGDNENEGFEHLFADEEVPPSPTPVPDLPRPASPPIQFAEDAELQYFFRPPPSPPRALQPVIIPPIPVPSDDDDPSEFEESEQEDDDDDNDNEDQNPQEEQSTSAKKQNFEREATPPSALQIAPQAPLLPPRTIRLIVSSTLLDPLANPHAQVTHEEEKIYSHIFHVTLPQPIGAQLDYALFPPPPPPHMHDTADEKDTVDLIPTITLHPHLLSSKAIFVSGVIKGYSETETIKSERARKIAMGKIDGREEEEYGKSSALHARVGQAVLPLESGGESARPKADTVGGDVLRKLEKNFIGKTTFSLAYLPETPYAMEPRTRLWFDPTTHMPVLLLHSLHIKAYAEAFHAIYRTTVNGGRGREPGIGKDLVLSLGLIALDTMEL